MPRERWRTTPIWGLPRVAFSAWPESRSNHQPRICRIVIQVLYVEDNDDDLYMLKMRLQLLGDFEVLGAEDGEQGC